MVHVFIFVKWEDDWNWEKFWIFQASWVLQWQMVEPCSCPPAKKTYTVQLEGKRDAWGYRSRNKSVWRNCRLSWWCPKSMYCCTPCTALCVHRNTVFVCDTGNKAVKMLASAKGLMAQYANVSVRLDKKVKEEDLPRTFEDHVKSVEELVAFLSNHDRKPWRERTSGIPTVPT